MAGRGLREGPQPLLQPRRRGADRHGVRQRQPGHGGAQLPRARPGGVPAHLAAEPGLDRPVHRQRRRTAAGRRRRDRALGRQGAEVLGHRLPAAFRARAGAGRRPGRLAVQLRRDRALLRRGGAADRRAGRHPGLPRHREKARAPRRAVPDAARPPDALVDRGGGGRHGHRPAPVPVPDGDQLTALQRPARLQQLRVLQQLRLPGGGQAGRAHPAAAGAADRAGAAGPGDDGHQGPAHRGRAGRPVCIGSG